MLWILSGFCIGHKYTKPYTYKTTIIIQKYARILNVLNSIIKHFQAFVIHASIYDICK